MADIRIGISGWRYTPWRGDFYPKGLIQANELAFASRAVRGIEINGSFYALQAPDRYAEWYAATPEGFMFSVKGPRYITHTRRLKEIETPLANFYASGMFQLKEKLGPFLWQFPPNFRFDPERFEAFLQLLPRTGAQARALAEKAEARLHKPGYLDIPKRGALRHAVEIRHESFATPEFVALLRRHNVALVVADTAGKWPYAEDLTADFVYIRLHGDAKLYESGYSEDALDRWQARIDTWSQGRQVKDAKNLSPARPRPRKSRDVFCFFDNDVKVHAPYDARALLSRLRLEHGLTTVPGEPPADGLF
ncbi:DUF72 domain-containing protein [Pseudomonas japonica]|uniref:DUF72 domain-containing protein n=1 Tax=Pseudomonas japonica TaxID=256466 RepID=UPI0015E44C33|nr:DUF72 domain-containing protein [Pseudomonas japonica]MBA1245182.1 DUF72 domain-containing protein [Pseudomonas japonica]